MSEALNSKEASGPRASCVNACRAPMRHGGQGGIMASGCPFPLALVGVGGTVSLCRFRQGF